MIFRSLLNRVSPSGSNGRLSVFIFHRVLPEPDPLFPTEVYADRFDTMCGWISQWFNVLPLDEAAKRLASGTLPARAAAITFDDGYADNYRIALPILSRHQLNATFFIATGFLDGGCMWNDVVIDAVRRTRLDVLPTEKLNGLGLSALPVRDTREKATAISLLIDKFKYEPIEKRVERVTALASLAEVVPPNDLMMTSDEVRAMRHAGMVIGAHTVSHPILATMDHEKARAEIASSKRMLEDLLRQEIRVFAYPNGKPGVDFTPDTVNIVRELGFQAAVTTRWASAQSNTDLFQIPRFTPWDQNKLRFGLRLIGNLRAEALKKHHPSD